LIQKKGPNAFSLREVAKKAGVSHAAPYRHFKDKAALLEAIAQLGFERLSCALLEVEQEYAGDPQRQLQESGLAYVRLAVENPEMTQIMFGGYIEKTSCPDDSCAKEQQNDSSDAYSRLVQIIANGQKAGLYRDEDIQVLALSCWSMMHGFAMLITGAKILNNQEEIEATAQKLHELLFLGISKRSA